MKSTKEIGRFIRDVRKNKSMLISDLSLESKKGRDKISELENGKTDYKISTLLAVIKALGYEIDLKKIETQVIKGYYSCSCHPFKTLKELKDAERQVFQIGERVLHRCTQKEGVINTFEGNKHYTVKYGNLPRDIELNHCSVLIRIK